MVYWEIVNGLLKVCLWSVERTVSDSEFLPCGSAKVKALTRFSPQPRQSIATWLDTPMSGTIAAIPVCSHVSVVTARVRPAVLKRLYFYITPPERTAVWCAVSRPCVHADIQQRTRSVAHGGDVNECHTKHSLFIIACLLVDTVCASISAR